MMEVRSIENPTLTLMDRGAGKRWVKRFFPITLSLSKHLLILCMVLIIFACGGGGGGSAPTSPSAAISFLGTTRGSDAIYMSQNSSLSNGDFLAIDIKANDISSNVYGAAFDVKFDSSKITYDSYVSGSFLESGGNMVNYQVGLQSGNSKLVIGISRQGPVSGISGSGTLVTLKFKVTGSSVVVFSNNALKDSSNQTISGIIWYGGAVMVE